MQRDAGLDHKNRARHLEDCLNPVPEPKPPSRGKRRRLLSALLVLSAVALGILFSVLLVWSTISKERTERLQTARYAEVVSALRDINRAALNAETGQRGYFITLDRRYRASYEFGRDLYPRAIERLKTLSRSSEDARIERLVAEVEDAGDAKIEELAQTVELIEAGEIVAAQQRILSNEGRLYMERLNDALTRLEAVERGLQSNASQQAFRSERQVLPLLVVTLVLMAAGLGFGIVLAMRASRAEALAGRAQELEEARDRADLLARELNHRVKNLFAVILAIVRMSGRGQPEAAPVVDNIAARIHALLEAHNVTQGPDGGAGEGEARMAVLVDKVLAPYRSEGNKAEIGGDEVSLTAKQATPVGLVLHELATNAVKYGAWSGERDSADKGHITIDWKRSEGGIVLCWTETGASIAVPDGREGFGSMLMRSAARQLDGEIERRFEPGRMVVEMHIPERD
ncbi:MAG: histidine kinase [Croceicoccus sp.]|nr:histidine kinase [Croceicoccus sp.]MAL27646.1 histidine kinase [Croceicoccus sp.]|tara:strand:+ start:816 stop:2189 length:1374 start_codon:yes stop_codon:yes gene_type:complete